jgi:hypothetical protein
MAKKKKEKEDKPVKDDSAYNEEVLEAIRLYKRESEDSRSGRDKLNKRNWAAYFSRQDWSHKKADQSKEFNPMTSMGVESVAATVKRALTGFGNYFSMNIVNESIMTSQQAGNLLKHHLEDEKTDFIDAIEQGVKIALLSSVMTFKVRHEVVDDDFVIKVDSEKPEKTYPDPTGRNLYFIHEVIKDLHEVVKLAKQGIYNKEEVAKITTDFIEYDKLSEQEKQKNHSLPLKDGFRKRVLLHEVHGTIINKQGEVIEEGIVATMANNKYLLRKPHKNPRLHGKSQFVMTPIIKVPGSVWHKSLYDDAVRINLYMNELQNLMLDGGLAAAHDIKVLRQQYLEKPEQAAGGIPPGTTLIAKEDMPANVSLLETVKSGDIPADAFNMLNLSQRAFDMASLFNDIKAGLLPQRQVKATEVVEKEQATSQQLDGFARTVEKAIDKVLRLIWAETMQFRNNYFDVDHIIGQKAAFALSMMSPEERYDMFAKKTEFKVNGISSLITRGKNFQKLMVFVDSTFKNPVLAQEFSKRFSANKIINKMLEGLDLDPSSIELDKGEEGISPEMIQQLSGQQKTGINASAAGGRNPLPDERVPQPAERSTV